MYTELWKMQIHSDLLFRPAGSGWANEALCSPGKGKVGCLSVHSNPSVQHGVNSVGRWDGAEALFTVRRCPHSISTQMSLTQI